MRYLKILALAAVAATALIAFLGAGSASATVLCKAAITEGCAASGSDYPVETEIDMSLEGTTATRATDGTLLDTCTEGTLRGLTTNTGSASETVDWNLTHMQSSNCTTTTDAVVNGRLEVHWIPGTDNGTLTVFDTRVTKTIFGVTCVYGPGASGADLGTLTGGSVATLDVEVVLPKISGGFVCPADVVWVGAYIVTTPQPLYVSKN
jgi:hypothetical protein